MSIADKNNDIKNQDKEREDDDYGPLFNLEDEMDNDPEADSPLFTVDDSEDENEEKDEDNIEDEEEEEETEESIEEEAERLKKPSAFSIMWKTMMTPVEGWKALKRARLTAEEFANGCYFPMIGFAAVSEISKVFYEANHTLSDWLLDGLSTFLTFFFGYFTILLAGGLVLPKKSRHFLKKDIGKEFVMLNLSTLALFWSVLMIIPMLDPVLVFLPIWTIYLIYKGIRVIRVPSDVENSTTGFMCLLILGAPLLWNWIIRELLIPFTGI